MRDKGGLRKIVEAVEKLKPRHKYHIKHYGQGNEVREHVGGKCCKWLTCSASAA